MPSINKPNKHFDVVTYTGNAKYLWFETGQVTYSTAQKKFGNGSGYFSGSSVVPGSFMSFNQQQSQFAFGSGSFTIEFWVRFDAVNFAQSLYDSRPYNTHGVYPWIALNNTGKIEFIIQNTVVIVSSTSLSADTWYHIAVCRSGTSTKLFINGTQEGSTFSDSYYYRNDNGSERPIFGMNGFYSPSNYYNVFKGYMDDIRVYKGAAKYTANFTPPAAAILIGPDDPYWDYCSLAIPFDMTTSALSDMTFSTKPEVETALSFKPDLIWLKTRSDAYNHTLHDTVRGVSPAASSFMYSNLIDKEATWPGYGVIGVTNTGFVLGGVGADSNYPGKTYVAWCWKAGNGTVTNTTGTVTSTVSANKDAGFSILKFDSVTTGTSTVGHGLNAAPKFFVTKVCNRTGGSWVVYHDALGPTKRLKLELTDAAAGPDAGPWNNTAPTSSVISLGDWHSASNPVYSLIAYCWSEVPGFSSFGSYTGNGNANGPFVNLGFKPALLLIKCSSGTGNWVMLDNKRGGANVDNDPVWANLANVEGTTDLADLLSNGFKIRSTSADVNTNAATYVYCAWAEMPFKNSLGR